jgi:DNA-binding CsgD family transcriptional regulator
MSNAGQRKRLQEIAGARVTDIRQKIAELESVANNLDAQIEICASTAPLQACPIMTSLGGDAGVPDAPGFDSQSGEAKPEPARGIKGKFSSRELEVLRWTAEGKTSAEIGQILHISERAVIFHVNNSMTKLRATNRTQAAVKAVCLGLIVFRPKLTADMPLF